MQSIKETLMFLIDIESPDLWTQRISAIGGVLTTILLIVNGILSYFGRQRAEAAVAENTRISEIAAKHAVDAAQTVERVELKADATKEAVKRVEVAVNEVKENQ